MAKAVTTIPASTNNIYFFLINLDNHKKNPNLYAVLNGRIPYDVKTSCAFYIPELKVKKGNRIYSVEMAAIPSALQ